MRTVGLLLWASSVLPVVAAEQGEVRLRALSEQAIAGTPVVVELQVVNPTSQTLSTYELDDPAIARIFWTWRAASGKTLEVRMRHYYFSVIPEPAFPKKVEIPPQGTLSRFHTVPTPLDFPDGEAWVLGVRIRDPIDQTLATAEVTYQGHRPAGGSPATLDAGLAQAALLEYSRADVLQRVSREPILAEVTRGAEARDPVAELVLVSKRLRTREDPTPAWDESAPPEVRLLRSYLLLTEIKNARARRASIPPGWLRLTKRLDPSDPLTRAVKDALRAGQRSAQ
jgi:hypothetical protein